MGSPRKWQRKAGVRPDVTVARTVAATVPSPPCGSPPAVTPSERRQWPPAPSNRGCRAGSWRFAGRSALRGRTVLWRARRPSVIEYNRRNKVAPPRCSLLRGAWCDDLMVFGRRSPLVGSLPDVPERCRQLATRARTTTRVCRRSAVVHRRAVRHGAAADAAAAGRGGPRSGHLPEGVPGLEAVRARHEPEGVAVHDPPQHVPEHAPARRPEPGRRQQRDRRTGRRRRAGTSGRRSSCSRERRSTAISRRRSTRCPKRSGRPSGCATSRSSRTPRSRASSDVPIGTVMSRISRGRRMLHERLTRRRAAAKAR